MPVIRIGRRLDFNFSGSGQKACPPDQVRHARGQAAQSDRRPDQGARLSGLEEIQRLPPQELGGDTDAPAQAADWAPIRHTHQGRVQLHDRASYRYFWQVLQSAHRTLAPAQQPAELVSFFTSHQD